MGDVDFDIRRGILTALRSAKALRSDIPQDLAVEHVEDEAGKTWISYNEPSWIAQRHGASSANLTGIKLTDLLSAVITSAAGPSP